MGRTPRWLGSSSHRRDRRETRAARGHVLRFPRGKRSLRRCSRVLPALALLLSLLLLPGLAFAASRVVVLEPPAGDAVTVEAAARLRGELRAAGFEVVQVALDATRPPLEVLGDEASRAGAFAAVLVLPRSRGAAVDLMVVDRATQKTVLRTVAASNASGDGAAAEVALRAVELLQASLLEATHPPPAAAALPRPAAPLPVPADVTRWVAPRPPPLSGFTLGAGVALLHAFGDIGPQVAPALRLGWGSRLGVGGRLTIAGPTAGPALDAGGREATVRQELALVELMLAREIGTTGWVPSASLGTGVMHLAASGTQSDDSWALVAAPGLGLAYRIDPRWSVCADAHLLFAEPALVVKAGDERVGRAGRPSMLATLGIAVRLGDD